MLDDKGYVLRADCKVQNDNRTGNLRKENIIPRYCEGACARGNPYSFPGNIEKKIVTAPLGPGNDRRTLHRQMDLRGLRVSFGARTLIKYSQKIYFSPKNASCNSETLCYNTIVNR